MTAAGPGEVTGVTTFDPFPGHDVRVARAAGVIVIMAHAHARETRPSETTNTNKKQQRSDKI